MRFIAIVSTALKMGMSFAHTLELPGKMTYDGKLWWHLSRTLYGAQCSAVGDRPERCAFWPTLRRWFGAGR